jgi:hypothetical protein
VREWRYNSIILDIGPRWRRVVSFRPRPLYLQGKTPLYPLYRRLGGIILIIIIIIILLTIITLIIATMTATIRLITTMSD